MSGMGWAFIFMFVILKIPICAALYLVWWSSRAPDPAEEQPVRDLGGRPPDHPRRPRWPRPPRRGPHAEPAPKSPARMRLRGRRLTRSHG